MKRIKRLSALLAAILIFTLTAPAAAAAEDMISVRTAEDLLELSRKCMLDSWSQGKIVTLEADIDLTLAKRWDDAPEGSPFRGHAPNTHVGLRLDFDKFRKLLLDTLRSYQ